MIDRSAGNGVPALPRGEARLSRRILLAFGVVVLLSMAQLGWWILFLVSDGGRQLAEAERRFDAQCVLADRLVGLEIATRGQAFSPEDFLAREFPHLEWLPGSTPPGSGRVALRQEEMDRLEGQRHRHIRMFLSEGVAFLLVMLAGVWIIYRTLRREVLLKRQQSNFMAAVTHELKSPLASIRLLTETMERLELDPNKKKEYLRSILLDVDRLTGLVSNILSVARLEAGKGGGVAVRTDLRREVEGLRQALQDSLGERGVELDVDLPPDEVAVRGDPESVRTVIRNLVENAAKYGEKGKPVCVTLQRRGKQAVLEVKDQGMGLSREDCRRVFEKFYRVGDELVRQVPGSGLGLYLVQALVRECGGEVEAYSPGPGRGATFRVTLPLDSGEAA